MSVFLIFLTKIYCKDGVFFQDPKTLTSSLLRTYCKIRRDNKEVPCHGMQPLVANGRGTQTVGWYNLVLGFACGGLFWLKIPVKNG